MQIRHYPETDSLYVYVSKHTISETMVLGEGIQADFDREGSLIGVEIEHVEFDANPETLNVALMKLTESATAEERRQIGCAFDQILAGKHKQSNPIIQE